MKNEGSFATSFNEAAVRLGTHCWRLEQAIAKRKANGLMRAAENAASIWHDGRRACRRLAAQDSGNPSLVAAWNHLWNRYKTLLSLLTQALRVAPTPEMRGKLRGLRERLSREMSRPLGDGVTGRRKHAETAPLTP